MSKALLIMDIQNSVMARIQDPSLLLNNLNTAIAAARKAGIPVIFLTLGFREGFPEISGRNKLFKQLKTMPAFMAPDASAIHPGIQRLPEEVHITKRRISAFTGSDLEVVLRAGDIDHLVLCGVATSGVVLSTMREAMDKDYELTILEDCCNDADEEVHRVLTKKVFARHAEVLTNTAWIESL